MQPFHLVRSAYKGQPFVHETDLDGTTREQLVSQIAQGQFDTGTLEGVLYVDPTSGSVADVSREIAQALSEFSFRESDTIAPSAAAFVEAFGFESYSPPTYCVDPSCHHPDQRTVWSHAA